MFKWKIDVMDELRFYGYTTYSKQSEILPSGTLTRLRHDEMVDLKILSRLCKVFECDIGDLILYVPDDEDPSIKHYKSRRKK